MLHLILTLLFFGQSDIPVRHVKPVSSKVIAVPEPSDICLSTAGFYIVSDDGMLFETDSSGNILRSSDFGAFDLEAVCSGPNGIWVLDERTRFASRVSPLTLKPLQTVEVPYSGGRNKGFESLAWNPTRGTYLAITEKNPVWIFELDTAFRVVNRQRLQGPSDVSGLAWKDNRLFLLSDEDHAVYRLNAANFEAEARVDLGILNPEGLVFSGRHLVVVSDDEQRMYRFEARTFFE